MFYKFLIIKWDDEGNNILDRHERTINRKCKFTAKNYVQRLFPFYFVELISISKTNERII